MKTLKYLLLTYLLAWVLTTAVDQYQHYNIPVEHLYELSILAALIVSTHVIAYFIRK
jgi:hypothetical protein